MAEEKYRDPRIPYNELKHWVLDGIYDDCRASIRPGRKPFDLHMSLASIAESYDDVFERPLENLMLAVFFIILDAENQKWEHYWRHKIDMILSQTSLVDLLSTLPIEEKEYFRVDLDVLGLWKE